MADREVQNSKAQVKKPQQAKNAPSGASLQPGKKPEKTATATQPSTSDLTAPGSLQQVLEVLKVMNENVKAQNERLNKQDERLEQVAMQWNGSEYYDEGHYDDQYEEYEDSSSVLTIQSETPSETKSVFKAISDKFNQSEVLADPVHPDLASLVNNSFRNGLSDEKYEELSKEIHRPQNCDALVKTRVNQGIWRLLKSWTQSDDSKLSNLQGVLLKATSSVVSLVEKLGAAESEHLELGTTAIALLGHAYKTINVRRKELHKNDLDSKYHYLASASLPYTDLLYGDDNDVNNNVREINTMDRIGKSVGRGGGPIRFGRGRGSGRGTPYNRGRGRGRGFTGRIDAVPGSSGQAKNSRPQKKQ